VITTTKNPLKTSKNPLETTAKKELKMNNKISMDFIMEEVYDSVKMKLVQCASTKYLWDNLQYIYARK
jgi:hypothetical protein